MKIIANCLHQHCPNDWDQLDGCGDSHLSFCAECFRKVQLVDTVEAIHGVNRLGQIAAAKKDLVEAFNQNKT